MQVERSRRRKEAWCKGETGARLAVVDDHVKPGPEPGRIPANRVGKTPTPVWVTRSDFFVRAPSSLFKLGGVDG